jgi:hypothetical protein
MPENRPQTSRSSESMAYMTGSHNPPSARLASTGQRTATINASPPANRFRRPRWLDLRLVVGVLLVIGAVLTGAVVVSSADHRGSYWALQHDVSAGTVLRGSDLASVRAQLGESARSYLSSADAVIGKSVLHAMGGGQLIPRLELAAPTQGVLVTVPVRSDNAPRLARADRVTLWLSTKLCRGVVLLGDAVVVEVRTPTTSALSSGNSLGLALRLPLALANRVVAALDADGAVIRVGVLSADVAGPPAAADVSRCWAAS